MHQAGPSDVVQEVLRGSATAARRARSAADQAVEAPSTHSEQVVGRGSAPIRSSASTNGPGRSIGIPASVAAAWPMDRPSRREPGLVEPGDDAGRPAPPASTT